jgi:hypothetical protein
LVAPRTTPPKATEFNVASTSASSAGPAWLPRRPPLLELALPEVPAWFTQETKEKNMWGKSRDMFRIRTSGKLRGHCGIKASGNVQAHIAKLPSNANAST